MTELEWGNLPYCLCLRCCWRLWFVQSSSEFPRCWELSRIWLVWHKPLAILRRSPSHGVRASVAQLAELRFCKPVVVGSSPSASFCDKIWPAFLALVNRRLVLFRLMAEGEYPSGQRGQTVNLVTLVFAGSNPASPSLCL